MATLTYKEQLLHPNWQRRRLQVLEAAGWACERCEGTDRTLHVHHKRYIKGRMAWEYADDELIALCEDCHAIEHEARDLLDQLLSSAHILGVIREKQPVLKAFGMLAGYFAGHYAGVIDEALIDKAQELAPGSFCSGVVIAGLIVNMDQRAVAELIQKQHRDVGFSMELPVAALVKTWAPESTEAPTP